MFESSTLFSPNSFTFFITLSTSCLPPPWLPHWILHHLLLQHLYILLAPLLLLLHHYRTLLDSRRFFSLFRRADKNHWDHHRASAVWIAIISLGLRIEEVNDLAVADTHVAASDGGRGKGANVERVSARRGAIWRATLGGRRGREWGERNGGEDEWLGLWFAQKMSSFVLLYLDQHKPHTTLH